MVSAVSLDLSNGTLDSLATLFKSGDWMDKQTSPRLKKQSTENPKRQGVFRWWHLVISCMPSSATKRCKNLESSKHNFAGLRNSDHPSYEQNLIQFNWLRETMMLHQTEVYSHFGRPPNVTCLLSIVRLGEVIFLATCSQRVWCFHFFQHQDTQWSCTRCDGYCDFLKSERDGWRGRMVNLQRCFWNPGSWMT